MSIPEELRTGFVPRSDTPFTLLYDTVVTTGITVVTTDSPDITISFRK